MFNIRVSYSRSIFYGKRLFSNLSSILYTSYEADDHAEWERLYQRRVPRTSEEMKEVSVAEIDMPPDPRLLKVAIVGVPNSGKSTLINRLMGWRVCSVSKKVHTTRCNARAVQNIGSTQLVFLDTPGIISPSASERFNLSRTLLTAPEKSVHSADLIAVLHDVSNIYAKFHLDQYVLRLLALYPAVPTILILNKVDTIKKKANLLNLARILTDGKIGGQDIPYVKVNQKRSKPKPGESSREVLGKRMKESSINSTQSESQEISEACKADAPSDQDTDLAHSPNNINRLSEQAVERCSVIEDGVFSGKISLTEKQALEFIKNRVGWPLFQELFMISALDGTGVSDVLEYFMGSTYSSPWIYSSKVVTDQNPYEIAKMAVREKFLEEFKFHVPYRLKFGILLWEISDADVLNICMKVEYESKSLIRSLVGVQGRRIAKVAREAEQELRNTFHSEVQLRLNLEFNKNLKSQKILT